MARFRRVCAALASVAAVFGCSNTSSPNPAPPNGHRGYGRKHSRDDKSGVGQNRAAPSCSVTRPGPDSTPPSSIDASLEPVRGPITGLATRRCGPASQDRSRSGPSSRGRAQYQVSLWRLQQGNLAVTGRLKTAQGIFTADFPLSGYGSTGLHVDRADRRSRPQHGPSRPHTRGPGVDVGHVPVQPDQVVPNLRRTRYHGPVIECCPAHILGVTASEVLTRPMRSK
jgi:hypothetical protein